MTSTINILDILFDSADVPWDEANDAVRDGHVYIDGRLVRDRRQRFDVNEISIIEIRGSVVWESE